MNNNTRTSLFSPYIVWSSVLAVIFLLGGSAECRVGLQMNHRWLMMSGLLLDFFAMFLWLWFYSRKYQAQNSAKLLVSSVFLLLAFIGFSIANMVATR